MELGRCREALGTIPSQLKSDQQLLCKILLQRSSSIKKRIHLQWADQSLLTESCQLSCDKKPCIPWQHQELPPAHPSSAGKPTAHKAQCGSSTFLLITSALAVPGGFLLSLSPWGMLMAFLCSLVIEQTHPVPAGALMPNQILSKLHSACRSNV